MDRRRLRGTVKRQIDQKKQAERSAKSLITQTVYLGTTGVMLALPIVAGAYLGSWLDGHAKGFSFSWTVSLILIGVFVGILNVVIFIRQTWN
jgi:ATP synthase protein I